MKAKNCLLLALLSLGVSSFALPPMEHNEEHELEGVNAEQQARRDTEGNPQPEPNAPPEIAVQPSAPPLEHFPFFPPEIAVQPSAPPLEHFPFFPPETTVQPSAPPLEHSSFLNIFYNALNANRQARRFIITQGGGGNPFSVHAVDEDPDERNSNREENIAINKMLQLILIGECPLINSEDLFESDLAVPLSAERLQQIMEHVRAAAYRSSSSFSVYDQEGNRFARIEEVKNEIESLASELKRKLDHKGRDPTSIRERDELAHQWATAVKEDLQARKAGVISETVAKAQMSSLTEEALVFWVAAIKAAQRVKERCDEAIVHINRTIELANNDATRERRATELQETEKEKEVWINEKIWREEMSKAVSPETRAAMTQHAFEELKKAAQEFTNEVENLYTQRIGSSIEDKLTLYQQAAPKIGMAEYYWTSTSDMIRQGFGLAVKKDKPLWQSRQDHAQCQLHQVEALAKLAKAETFMALARTEATPFMQAEVDTGLETTLNFLKNKHAELPAPHADRVWWSNKIQNTENSASKFYQEPAAILWQTAEAATQAAYAAIDTAQALLPAEQEAFCNEALKKIDAASDSYQNAESSFIEARRALVKVFPRRADLEREWDAKLTASRQGKERLSVLKLLVQAEQATSIAIVARTQDPAAAPAAQEKALAALTAALRSLNGVQALPPALAPWWKEKIRVTENKIHQFHEEPAAILWKAAEAKTQAACAAKRQVQDVPFTEKEEYYNQAFEKIEDAILAWTNADPSLRNGLENISRLLTHRLDLRDEWQKRLNTSMQTREGLEALKLLTRAEKATDLVAAEQNSLLLKEKIETAIEMWNRYQTTCLDNSFREGLALTYLTELRIYAKDAVDKRSKLSQLLLQRFSLKECEESTALARRAFTIFQRAFNTEALEKAFEGNRFAQKNLSDLIATCSQELRDVGMMAGYLKEWWVSMKCTAQQEQRELTAQSASIKKICDDEVQKKARIVQGLQKEEATLKKQAEGPIQLYPWEEFTTKAKALQAAYEDWERVLSLARQAGVQTTRNNSELQEVEMGVCYWTNMGSWGEFRKCVEHATMAREKAEKSSSVSDWEDFVTGRTAVLRAVETWKEAADGALQKARALQRAPYAQAFLRSSKLAKDAVAQSIRILSFGEFKKCESIATATMEEIKKNVSILDLEDSIFDREGHLKDFIAKAKVTLCAAEAWKEAVEKAREKKPNNSDIIKDFKIAEESVAIWTAHAAWGEYNKYGNIGKVALEKAVSSNSILDWEDFIKKGNESLLVTAAWKKAVETVLQKKLNDLSFINDLKEAERSLDLDLCLVSWGKFKRWESSAIEAKEKALKSDLILDWNDFISTANTALYAAEVCKVTEERTHQKRSDDSNYVSHVENAKQVVAVWDYQVFLGKFRRWKSSATEAKEKALKSDLILDWNAFISTASTALHAAEAWKKAMEGVVQKIPDNSCLMYDLKSAEREISTWTNQISLAKGEILWIEVQHLNETALKAHEEASKLSKPMPDWEAFMTKAKEWELLVNPAENLAAASKEVSDWENYKTKLEAIKNSCTTREEALNQAVQVAPFDLKKNLRTQYGEVENEIAFWNNKIAIAEFTILEKAAQRLAKATLAAYRSKIKASASSEVVSNWEKADSNWEKAEATKTAYERASEIASESWRKTLQQDVKEFWNGKLGEIENEIARWKRVSQVAEQQRQEIFAAALKDIENEIVSWNEMFEPARQKGQESFEAALNHITWERSLEAAAQEAVELKQGVQDFLDALLEEVGAKYDALFAASLEAEVK